MGRKPWIVSALVLGLGVTFTGCTTTKNSKDPTGFKGGGKETTLPRNKDASGKPADGSQPPPKDGTTTGSSLVPDPKPINSQPNPILVPPAGSNDRSGLNPPITSPTGSPTTNQMQVVQPFAPSAGLQQAKKEQLYDPTIHEVAGTPPLRQDELPVQPMPSDPLLNYSPNAKALPPISVPGSQSTPALPGPTPSFASSPGALPPANGSNWGTPPAPPPPLPPLIPK